MIYDTGSVVIAAPSMQARRDAIRQYGVYDIPYPEDTQITVIPSIIIITTELEAVETPAGIKWALVDGTSKMVTLIMRARSGPPLRMDQVIQALNEEYAIDPRKLMLPPAT